MIDKKKLINYIKAEINPYGKPFNDTAYEFGLKLIDYIEGMEKQPQVGGWIPVSERLPEEEGRYLCAYGKNLMCVYSFSNDLFSVDDYDFAKYKFEKKKGFYAYDSEWGYWEVDFIKAWQPLPEPFKEEEDV